MINHFYWYENKYVKTLCVIGVFALLFLGSNRWASALVNSNNNRPQIRANSSDQYSLHRNPASPGMVIISGNVGSADVHLVYTVASITQELISGADGSYTIEVPLGWSGILIPYLPGYRFDPPQREFSALAADQNGQDFVLLAENWLQVLAITRTPTLTRTPTPQVTSFTLSGNTGVSGVTLRYSVNNINLSVISGINGIYIISISALGSSWSGLVIPEKLGYSFSPNYLPYDVISASQVNQNYIPSVLATNTPTVSPTVTLTRTLTSTPTETITPTVTSTTTNTSTRTITPSPTETRTSTVTRTPTITRTPTNTSTVTRTATRTLTRTPTKTPTKTKTSTPRPNILKDPGFELATPLWIQTTNYAKTVQVCKIATCGSRVSAKPRAGVGWSWLGGASGVNQTASISQKIVFPAGTKTLDFYLWIGYAGAGSDINDKLVVSVDGTPVFVANATQKTAYPGYVKKSVSVSKWANGLAHTIKFTAVTSMQVVNFNLDDIALR